MAEETISDDLASRLGRATKFAIFEVRAGRIRGPVYRVRHQEPGENCEMHDELARLLEDCDAVIVKSAGQKLVDRLRLQGVNVVVSGETGKPKQLVLRYISGELRVKKPVKRAVDDGCGKG